MKTRLLPLVAGFLMLSWPGTKLFGQGKEMVLVESAGDVLETLGNDPLKGIPPLLMRDAQGVVIVPELIKAGFVVGGRHGRGVLFTRDAHGAWSNPVFLMLTGGSVGFQAGVQSIDVVLVFKTRNSLDQVLKGKSKLTLGADVGVAAGPVGRQAEASTDTQLKAEIFSYSRSRGLFAGVSLEGAALRIDFKANEAFYQVRGGSPRDVLAMPAGPQVPAVDKLRAMLSRYGAMTPPPPMDGIQPPLAPLPSPQTLEPPISMPPSPLPTPPKYQQGGPDWRPIAPTGNTAKPGQPG